MEIKSIKDIKQSRKLICEYAIISEMVQSPNPINLKYFSSIHPDFFNKENRKVFVAINNSDIKETHTLQIILQSNVSKETLVNFYSNEVSNFKNQTTFRNMVKILCNDHMDNIKNELNEKFDSGKIKFEEMLKKIESERDKFPKLYNQETKGDSFSDYIDKCLSGDYKQIISNQFPFVNRAFGTFEGGNIVTITAKTGVGKSLFSLQLLNDLLDSNKGTKGIYFSLEMPELELMQRLVSAKFNINSLELRNITYIKRITKSEITLLKDYTDYIKSKMFIHDRIFELSKITKEIETLKADNPEIKFVVIDFVNMVKLPSKGENRYLDIGEIMQTFKRTAIENDIVIFTVAQNNRAGDVSDSYTIYQLSDYVMDIVKPIQEPEMVKQKNVIIGDETIEIIPNLFLITIKKNRHTEYLNNVIPLIIQDNKLNEQPIISSSKRKKEPYSKNIDSDSEIF